MLLADRSGDKSSVCSQSGREKFLDEAKSEVEADVWNQDP